MSDDKLIHFPAKQSNSLLKAMCVAIVIGLLCVLFYAMAEIIVVGVREIERSIPNPHQIPKEMMRYR